MIRVLVVDDSPSVRAVLRRFLSRAGDLTVVGEAVDGERAVAMVADLAPDVVVMDLLMPVLDGFAAIERIMAQNPVPILVLSSRANRNQMQVAFEAIRRGAIEVLPKPEDTESWQLLAESLPDAVRAAAAAVPARAAGRAPRRAPRAVPTPPRRDRPLRWIAIGASTGGPAALRELFLGLPAALPASVLIVQHIAAGFEAGLAEWLNKEFPHDIRLARAGERPAPGAVRLAPSGAHLLLGPNGELRLDAETEAQRGHRPSVDALFLSCAEASPRETAGVLLTGMGADGVLGLSALRAAGALTVVQDEASSAVFGMPRVALERGAADLALPPREIALWLARGVAGGGGAGA
ncbi:MAG TPA: chemotaxis-specific protein-glutamate methyltransferase CheB [Thermoanaerobaculia bacterium]|nr:chemotaxis-specific protein-glutamate methyltransferase CheB [Thermoanaerobaculia bacterium]